MEVEAEVEERTLIEEVSSNPSVEETRPKGQERDEVDLHRDHLIVRTGDRTPIDRTPIDRTPIDPTLADPIRDPLTTQIIRNPLKRGSKTRFGQDRLRQLRRPRHL